MNRGFLRGFLQGFLHQAKPRYMSDSAAPTAHDTAAPTAPIVSVT